MLRSGLLVLLIDFILWIVAGRLYVGGIGLGLGLIVAWYLLEREPSLPPATEEDLSALEESTHEAATELTLPELGDLLSHLRPSLTRGFGEAEAERLIALAERLRLQHEGQIEFQTTYLGGPTPLRIHLFKDNLASISVTFYTTQLLKNLLLREIAALTARREK